MRGVGCAMRTLLRKVEGSKAHRYERPYSVRMAHPTTASSIFVYYRINLELIALLPAAFTDAVLRLFLNTKENSPENLQSLPPHRQKLPKAYPLQTYCIA